MRHINSQVYPFCLNYTVSGVISAFTDQARSLSFTKCSFNWFKMVNQGIRLALLSLTVIRYYLDFLRQFFPLDCRWREVLRSLLQNHLKRNEALLNIVNRFTYNDVVRPKKYQIKIFLTSHASLSTFHAIQEYQKFFAVFIFKSSLPVLALIFDVRDHAFQMISGI